MGTVVPVSALRTGESTGVGEFLDLIEFGDLCAKMGIGLIQILPVNDTGYESPPYSALTVFALNPLYLRLADIHESAGFKREINSLRTKFEDKARFPYYELLRAKMELLRSIYAKNQNKIIEKAQGKGSFGQWIERNPWVKEYAVYRRLKALNGEKSWKEWEAHVNVSAEEIEAFWNNTELQAEHLFWVWIQQALDIQFTRASEYLKKKDIILQGDLPILIGEDSCDAWAHPEFFHQELSAGAPPDMYSPVGQNWGFPIYNWDALAVTDYQWWRERLKVAQKYYSAYRIDHVLGFFRIWASSRADNSAALGRFVPEFPITLADLKERGFDEERIRWLSKPHVPTNEVFDALAQTNDKEAEAERVFATALERIGTEELWLFKDFIHGEKDIAALGLSQEATSYLLSAWINRALLEFKPGVFSPVWNYADSRSFKSLSDVEREIFIELAKQRIAESEEIWEKQGFKLLSVLYKASDMIPFAEDLGAVPECVPKVLKRLKIYGLRVVRWFREYDKERAPYIPFNEYPELTVITSSVHDSSPLREWWNTEADQTVFSGFVGVPSLPKVYNPGTAQTILKKIASATSQIRVFPIQDLLHLSPRWYRADISLERINIPGTVSPTNWSYRLPAAIARIEEDEELLKAVRKLANTKASRKKQP
jgi:4-alpha-glucanotransferase